MINLIKNIPTQVASKMLQYALAIGAGLLAAFEATIIYVGLCYLAIVIDVIAAWCLARRIHAKSPNLSDGKFKSTYKFRIMITLIVVHLALMTAYYVDNLVISGISADTSSVMAQCFVIWAFIFYEAWSVLENWSSENDARLAHACQRIMVNKAERHTGVPLADILLNDKPKQSQINEDK